MVINMEGKAHELHKINQKQSSAVFESDEIRFLLTEDANAVSLNFNLTRTKILETGSAVYVLPKANHGTEKIDLNFFNRNRDSKSIQKRILFIAGTIEIQELTRNRLRMTFKGTGQPLTGKDQFPVEGSVNVTF